jgi:hypothetical protein
MESKVICNADFLPKAKLRFASLGLSVPTHDQVREGNDLQPLSPFVLWIDHVLEHMAEKLTKRHEIEIQWYAERARLLQDLAEAERKVIDHEKTFPDCARDLTAFWNSLTPAEQRLVCLQYEFTPELVPAFDKALKNWTS